MASDTTDRILHLYEVKLVTKGLEIRPQSPLLDAHLAFEASQVVRALTDFEQDGIVTSGKLELHP